MQAMHCRHMEGNALQYVFATCIYLRMQLHRGESHCVADAAHHAAEPDACQVLDERLCISSSKVLPVLSVLHDVPPDLAAVQSPGPPRRRHHPEK